jgi:Na+/H+ antiporter NhaD/arsenite permease-like protein
VPIVAAIVLLGCIALMLLILRGRQGRSEVEYERDPEFEEALERMRAWIRRPAVVIAGAVIVGLGLIATMARDPSRWAVLLLALAVLAAAVAGVLVAQRRKRERG